MRKRGERSPAGIDRGLPYQIAWPARFCENGGYEKIHEFLSWIESVRAWPLRYDTEWFRVCRFAEAGRAAKFKERFGGVAFDRSQRGKESRWARWNRG